jgi:hypothetical protein
MTNPGPRPCRLGGARAEAASGHAHWRHRMSLPFTICPGHGRCTRRRDWTAAAATAVATAAAVAAAGCGGGQPTAALPRRATPAAAPGTLTFPASSSPAQPSPAAGTRHGAISTYLSIWPAGDRAERSGSAAEARTILAAYASPAYIEFMIGGMRAYWRQREVAAGYMSDHILHATVTTGRNGRQVATVVDCQDASHHRLTGATTGKVIPGTRGPRQAWLQASLTFTGGHWLVSQITHVSNRC